MYCNVPQWASLRRAMLVSVDMNSVSSAVRVGVAGHNPSVHRPGFIAAPHQCVRALWCPLSVDQLESLMFCVTSKATKQGRDE